MLRSERTAFYFASKVRAGLERVSVNCSRILLSESVLTPGKVSSDAWDCMVGG